MTIDNFFAELRKVHSQFEWTLVPHTRALSERRASPRQHLRAIPRAGSLGTSLDPLGAVCYAHTGEVYEPTSWPNAGKALGLTASDSAALIAAAVDRTWIGPEGKREPVPVLIAIRIRLIKTVNSD